MCRGRVGRHPAGAEEMADEKGPRYYSGSPAKSHKGDIPNKVFAMKDKGFLAACEKAGVQPTARQASKFRLGKGAAFKAKGS